MSMFTRKLTIQKTSSFFLFGARGTGKSTYLKAQFKTQNPMWIDLLNIDTESMYSKSPQSLSREIESRIKKANKPDWVIIDEIQKCPALLDVVHSLIESHKIKFALTGSSARKLKRGAANMLGGRANVFALFPFTYQELGDEFDLPTALNWGTLPRIDLMQDERDRLAALRSYSNVYLKEEVLIEQLVRNITPFRGFLEIAAQMNGERLNYLKLAREVGVDPVTVRTYFDILEDTYLGFRLPAFHLSVRKSQLQQAKFYWFDLGVQRFLSGQSHSPLVPRTAAYGKAFESFIINEISRLNHYLEWDAKLSFLQTKNGSEVDLIISRGRQCVAIEIKSTDRIDEVEVRRFEELAKDIPHVKSLILISQCEQAQRIGLVDALPWQKALAQLEKGPF